MEDKGYLLEDGRIVRQLKGRTALARISYRETRYNLRRVLVTRTWIVSSVGDFSPVFGPTRAAGITRAEAIKTFYETASSQVLPAGRVGEKLRRMADEEHNAVEISEGLRRPPQHPTVPPPGYNEWLKARGLWFEIKEK